MLTTVQLPVRDMARAMVEIAIGPDAGTTAVESERVFTPTLLVERESVGRRRWRSASDEARLRQPPERQARRYFGAKATARAARRSPRCASTRGARALDRRARRRRDGCDALIAYRQTPGPEALFRDCRAAAFMRCAVDIRTVDVAAASRHGVLVTQASPGYVPAVAEWIVAAMIDLGRGLSRYAEAYHRERRSADDGPRAARLDARRDRPRPDRPHLAEPRPRPRHARARDDAAAVGGARPLRQVPLRELLAESDFVVCLAPASAETENLLDAAAFAAMKPAPSSSTPRAASSSTTPRCSPRSTRPLGGAALDVGRAPDQMPAPALARHPRVLATPHIGGLTRPAIEHQALETVAQLGCLLRGELPPARSTRRRDALARWREQDARHDASLAAARRVRLPHARLRGPLAARADRHLQAAARARRRLPRRAARSA
jgi:D-3-phosphoglycerate dehydrogenase